MKLRSISFVTTESTLPNTLISVYHKSCYSVRTKHHFSRPPTVSHAFVALKMRLSCDIQATTFELWNYHVLNKPKTHNHAFCLYRNLTLGVSDLVWHKTERASQLRIKDLQSLSIYMQVIVCLSLSVSVFVSVYGTKNVRVLLMVQKMFGLLG